MGPEPARFNPLALAGVAPTALVVVAKIERLHGRSGSGRLEFRWIAEQIAGSRLAVALESFAILDTRPNRIDDIVELTTLICETPVALVSLVTDDRQGSRPGSDG